MSEETQTTPESEQEGGQDGLSAGNGLPVHPEALRGDESASVVTCQLCHRERTEADWRDYNPVQVIFGQPLGWYSGDDGEICQQCMTGLLEAQR